MYQPKPMPKWVSPLKDTYRLHAHDRQHRQDHCKAAAAHAGKIVDAKDFFGFNRVYQIRNLLTSMRNEQCAF